MNFLPSRQRCPQADQSVRALEPAPPTRSRGLKMVMVPIPARGPAPPSGPE